MKVIGNDVYIQRGETWTLDMAVTNERGDPYMIFSQWENPYVAITVAAARYEQRGDFRRTYWLDLSQRWVEQADGSVVLEPVKRFISTEALVLPRLFSVNEAVGLYGVDAGGKIVLDETSDFDVTNYLFFTDPNKDDNRIYKYVKSYTLDADGKITDEEWEEYDFRLIKQFTTKDWMEQGYLFDIKILAGESLEEHIARMLSEAGIEVADLPWDDAQTQEYINLVVDDVVRAELQEIFDSSMPLMPDYDTKTLILQPTNLYVSANIQGGVK